MGYNADIFEVNQSSKADNKGTEQIVSDALNPEFSDLVKRVLSKYHPIVTISYNERDLNGFRTKKDEGYIETNIMLLKTEEMTPEDLERVIQNIMRTYGELNLSLYIPRVYGELKEPHTQDSINNIRGHIYGERQTEVFRLITLGRNQIMYTQIPIRDTKEEYEELIRFICICEPDIEAIEDIEREIGRIDLTERLREHLELRKETV